MTAVSATVLTVFVGVGLALGAFAARRPFIARLAVREVARRRWQSVLVVVGLAVGSAGVTAALIAGDAVDESAVLNAYRTWAGTDVVVAAADGSPFPADVADRLREGAALAGPPPPGAGGGGYKQVSRARRGLGCELGGGGEY
jgi:hypothetical protein